jgi:hypothetical protein
VNRSGGLQRKTPLKTTTLLLPCGHPYGTEAEARNSKSFQHKGAVIEPCRREHAGQYHVRVPQSAPGNRKPSPLRTASIRPVSAKRAAENRKRRKVVDALWPDRPACARPGCERAADDIHEPLTRARGGSITDRDNMIPLCRSCHDEVTFTPESELGWAYEAGLLRHSWAPGGDAA